ncbi:MAG: phage tail assembly chaperone [Pseudomonadota bacterium]
MPTKKYHFLPWNEIMKFGFGVMRFSPDVLWAMTPREFYAALEGAFGPPSSLSPPARGVLTKLMKSYPDK